MTIQASYRDRDRVFIVMDYFEHDSIKVCVRDKSNNIVKMIQPS